MKQETGEEKRKKLFAFAGSTLLILTLAFLYFEAYDPYQVPILLRIFLSAYWLYSLTGLIVSQLGNDKIVSKIYFNINR